MKNKRMVLSRAQAPPKPSKKTKKVKKAHLKDVAEHPSGGDLEVKGEFKGFDLEKLGVPKEAWPLSSKTYKGNLGYTLVSATTNGVTR